MPVVEESYNPDRTRLSLEFKKQANKTSEQNKRTKQANKINIEKQKRIIS